MKVKVGYNKLYGEKQNWIWSARENKWFRNEKGGELCYYKELLYETVGNKLKEGIKEWETRRLMEKVRLS